MSGNNSWNGRWSGDGEFYARTRALPAKIAKEKLDKILKEPYYQYNFGDGWRAAVEVKLIDIKTRDTINKNTKGFCGYDWMIDSIIKDGIIK